MLVCLDEGLRDCLEDRVVSTRPSDVPSASIVLLGPDWDRLRGWRLAGHTFGALVRLGPDGPPEDRALLEPLHTVSHPTTARVAAALEALTAGPRPGLVQLEVGTADLARRELARDDGVVRLTPTEVALLGYLVARPHRESTREELLVQVWGHAVGTAKTRSVDMAVARLRKKIERDPSSPRTLLTGTSGYRLVGARPRVTDDGLVGRAGDVEHIGAALVDVGRVTLRGPPGVGKTRLAEAVAAAWSGPVAFVRLDAVASGAAVLRAAAAALGVETSAMETATNALAGTLLVLDNAEHVLAEVHDVLERTRGLPTLVTSQVAPLTDDMRVIDVPPLPREQAVELFRQRAASHGVSPAPSDPVAELVDGLDRLPLAIELAAGRTRVLTVPDLVANLGQRLRWLRDRDGQGRHRALEAALEWSWDLLEDDERATLGALATFRGPFTLAGAAAILERSPVDAADAIEGLLERSLVARRADGFLLLAGVRAFAAQRGVLAHDAHARWGRELAERALQAVGSASATRVLGALEPCSADLEAAWRHAADPSVALALDALWARTGQLGRRVELLNEALRAHPDDATLLAARGTARPPTGDAAALADLRAALSRLVDPTRRARCATRLAFQHITSGDTAAAREVASAVDDPLPRSMVHRVDALSGAHPIAAMLEDAASLELAGRITDAFNVLLLAMSVAQDAADEAGLAAVIHRVSGLTDQLWTLIERALGHLVVGTQAAQVGRYEDVVAQMSRVTRLAARAGRQDIVRRGLVSLGVAAMHLGRYEETWEALARQLAMAQDAPARAWTLTVRGVLELEQHRPDAARATIDEIEGLAPPSEVALQHSLDVLRGLLALELGDREAAARHAAHMVPPLSANHRLQRAGLLAVARGTPEDLQALRAAAEGRVPARQDWRRLAQALEEGSPQTLSDAPIHTVARQLARAALP